MKWIGLTGGIATGKSSVSRILRQNEIPVLDADELARLALSPGRPATQSVLARWGKQVQGSSPDEVDRRKLGSLIFGQDSERAWLETQVHPEVQAAARSFRENGLSAGWQVAVYDVPLLFEKALESQFDAVLLVWCQPAEQISRLGLRNQLVEAEARARIASQMSTEQKRARTRWQIENPSSPDWPHRLKQETCRVWNQMAESIGLTKKIV
jgi:dephospho-CoA kinase